MKIIKLFIGKNKTAFIMATVIFFSGSVFGALSSCRMEPSASDELKAYISPYFDVDVVSAVDSGALFAADVIKHLRIAVSALISSLSFYFVPLFAFLLGLKGYQLGFAMGFVSGNFGTRGTALAVSSTLISYLTAIPIYFLIFVQLLKFAANMKNNSAHMSNRERRREYFSYFIFVLVICSLLCVSAGVGAWLTPLFVDIMN